MGAITRVPQTPSYVKGLINLRSTVIPVIDLRIRFGLPEVKRRRQPHHGGKRRRKDDRHCRRCRERSASRVDRSDCSAAAHGGRTGDEYFRAWSSWRNNCSSCLTSTRFSARAIER